jgi:DNA-binding NarL/FixJ family response regulator
MQRPASPPGTLSGPATIRALLKTRPGLGIVAHGDRPERHIVAEAVAAGANAYVMKSSSREELGRAVDAALESETFIDPAAATTGLAGGRRPITKRQRQILQLTADGESTARIAKRLGLSSETVKTHTKHLLARLGARDRAHAVAIGLRNALIE